VLPPPLKLYHQWRDRTIYIIITWVNVALDTDLLDYFKDKTWTRHAVMLFRCAFNIEIYVKVWILVIPPLTWVRLVTSSALQSRKWQLIGMSQWCRSALCGHPLPAHFQNFIQFCLVFVHLRYERSKIRDDDTILKSFLHLPIFCARCVGGFSDWQTRVVTPCYLLTSVIYFFPRNSALISFYLRVVMANFSNFHYMFSAERDL